MGLGAWAPIGAGTQARRPSWTAWGALWSVITVVGWAVSIATQSDIGGGLIILGWFGGIATSFAVRDASVTAVEAGEQFDNALGAGRQRLKEREQLRALATSNPALAREIGVGRPDTPGARHGEMVDINHATKHELTTLPGITPEIAEQIIQIRGSGIHSVEELGAAVDLDGTTVELLRDRVIFVAI